MAIRFSSERKIQSKNCNMFVFLYVCVFVHEDLSFKLREYPSINYDGIQSLSIEISSTESKNIIINTIYKSSNGDMKQCETQFQYLFSKNGKNRKNIVLAGDFNINFLDFETNRNVQDFLNLIFRYNMIPLTNKPTRVTKHSTNAIDHIITNSVIGHDDFKSAIIKADLSDHFPIVFAIKTNETTQRPVLKSTYKRSYCEKKLLTNLKILCATKIGMTFKKLKTPIKHIKTFSISLLTFTTIRSQNRKLKLNSRAIKVLGLLKVLQNHQKRNKDFMKKS